MTPREHDIEMVARAMTAGAPGEIFVARVMAPLLGAPQPGFTGRVMARVDARPQSGVGALHMLLAGVAMAAVVAAILWLPSRDLLPATAGPALAAIPIGKPEIPGPVAQAVGRAEMPRSAERVPSRPAAPRISADASLAYVPDRPLYQIAELKEPAGLAIAAIEAGPAAVGPLERPAALIVPGLRLEKEKP